jgi:hypothetical protein
MCIDARKEESANVSGLFSGASRASMHILFKFLVMQSSKVIGGRSALGVKPLRQPSCGIRRGLVTRAIAEPPTRGSVPFMSDSDHLTEWDPKSWRNFPALQQPEYPSQVL